MGELNFKILGDDRELRRKLKKLSKDISKDFDATGDVLAKSTNNANKAAKEHLDIIHKEEQAYKKRNQEAAKLPPPRKVDFGNSAAEIAAYKAGQSGNISGGSVAGPTAAYAQLANQATAASTATTKLTQETVKQTAATRAQSIAIEDLKRRLLVYQELQEKATDPDLRNKYNRQIQQTTLEINRMSNAGKEGFDKMGNAIKGSQGAISKAISGLFRMAYLLPGIGVAGLLAFAIDPIVAYLGKLDIFKTKTTEAEKVQASLAEKMGEVGSNAAKAAIDVDLMKQKFEQARSGIISKGDALRAYNEGIGKTLGFTNDLNTAEERVIRNGDAYVALMFKKAEAAALMGVYQEKMAKAAEELAKTDADSGSYIMSGTKGRGLKNAKGEDIYEANARRNREELAKPFQDEAEAIKKIILTKNNDIAKFANDNKLIIDPVEVSKSGASAANQYNSALAKRLDLINSINAASKEATAKNLTEEDNELAASEAKYAKMREDIIEFNKWAENYNKTHVRKIATVDVSQVDAIEENDRDAILDKQARAQYEQHQELLKQLRSYEQQRTDIQKKYSEDRATLTNTNDIAALDRLEQDELNQLDDANTQKLSAYQALFEGIEDLSNNAADVVIANAKDMLGRLISEGKISADLAKNIAKQLESATNSRKNRLPEQLRKLAGDIQNVASAVSGIDEQFGKVLNTIGDIIGSAGALKSSISDIGKANKKGDILGMLSGGLGAAGAVLGAVKSVVSLFDKSEERRARAAEQQKYAQDLQMKAINAQTQALQRQLDLIKDIYGAERIEAFGKSLEDLSLKESELTTSLSGRYKLTGDAGLDKILGKVNNGVGLNQIENQIFKAVKDLGIFVGKIDGLSMTELLGLADEGKLDEQTAAIVKNLEQIKKQKKDTENALLAEATGTTFTSIADEIVEMFSRGNAAAEDFGKNFEEIMKRSILSSFKRNALENQLQGFYEEFAEKAKSGGSLDESEIGGLRAMYDAIIANSQKQFKELEKATGISFKPDSASPQGNNLSGAVTGIRADQADILAGQLGGLRIAQIETLNIGRQHLLLKKQSLDIAMAGIRHLQAIEVNTLRTANNTDSLKVDMAGINRQMGSFINTLAANGRRI